MAELFGAGGDTASPDVAHGKALAEPPGTGDTQAYTTASVMRAACLPATENGAGDATPALAPIPAVVQDGLTLMEVLAVPRGPARMDHAPGKEAEGCAKIVLDAMAETAFAGLPSLLTTVLLHATPKDAKDAVATLPPNFAPAAAAVCRVLCDLSRLQQAKELFHSPDLRIELYHLLSFLLAFCTSADGSPTDVGNPKQQAMHTLRNAAVVLVGWFARLSKECQDMLVWGSGNQTPTILSRLSSQPYPEATGGLEGSR